MVKSAKASIGAVLFVVAICAVATWYFASTRADMPRRIQVEQARQESFELMRKAKLAEWATVIRSKEIAPGEDLKLVEIPDTQFGLTSTNCFIYTNATLRVAQFICPHE